MNARKPKNHRGLTLVEVTLIIAVLLGLISILFIGVAAYKKGSDRAVCLVTSATVQKAVRSYQNLYELVPGDPLVRAGTIVGPGAIFETDPTCPEYGAYLWDTTVPATGTPYIDCWDPNNGPEFHYPQYTAGW